MDPFTNGFRVVGGVNSERRLVDWQAAFTAHCNADPRCDPSSEGYLSLFTFPPSFKDHLQRNGGSTRGYDGATSSPWLWFDIDRSELADALADARKLSGTLLQSLFRSLDEDDALYFFSGSKGFHVGFPASSFGSGPSDQYHATAARVAASLAESVGVDIDRSIYDRVRCFRAPNSRHPRTGLHKVRLTHDELMGFTIERIKQLAAEPRPFELPTPVGPITEAVAVWREAVGFTTGQRTARAAAASERPGRLILSTLRFVRGTLPDDGDRNNTVFKAAANLRECGTPSDVISQLLDGPGRDCGLTPRELTHAVSTGITHADQQAGRRGG